MANRFEPLTTRRSLLKTGAAATALLAAGRPQGRTVARAQAASQVLRLPATALLNPTGPFDLGLIGGGVGIPPMIFYAETEVASGAETPWVIMGSELPFPFATGPAQLALPGVPESATHGLTRLEANGIPNRLATLAGLDGCFPGYVTGLADALIGALPEEQRSQVALYACGPTPMLAAVAALARHLGLPCQVSLEEYMACGVGGCAGCTVEVDTDDGLAMKRVCVDGPIFDAAHVFTSPPLPEPAETPFD